MLLSLFRLCLAGAFILSTAAAAPEYVFLTDLQTDERHLGMAASFGPSLEGGGLKVHNTIKRNSASN